jgi:hypothetical protein
MVACQVAPLHFWCGCNILTTRGEVVSVYPHLLHLYYETSPLATVRPSVQPLTLANLEGIAVAGWPDTAQAQLRHCTACVENPSASLAVVQAWPLALKGTSASQLPLLRICKQGTTGTPHQACRKQLAQRAPARAPVATRVKVQLHAHLRTDT